MNIIDNAPMSRYELLVDDQVAAIEDYHLRGDRIALIHTEVFEGHDGQGLARVLVDHVLADARSRGLGVLPECPFVRSVIEKDPDTYLDLVPTDVRAKFRLPE